MKLNFILSVLTIFIFNCALSQQSQNLPAPYQPDIFSKFPAVRDLSISPKGDEAYFTAQNILGELSVIVAIKCVDGKCEPAGIARFSGIWQDLEPAFSPNGLRLYFASNRPIHPDSANAKDFDIWYVERKSITETWSAPVRLDSPVNSPADEFYPILTNSQNLYFTSDRTGTAGKDDIFMARWNGTAYSTAGPLSDSVNSAGHEFNAYVAPDESFMIYTCYNREGGYGSGDLYISYSKNGNWSAPHNLGKGVNSKQMDYCPLVHNGMLYFTSRRSGVSSRFKILVNLEQIMNEMNRYDNGASRIYFVKAGWN